jgi:hypothetical protein
MNKIQTFPLKNFFLKELFLQFFCFKSAALFLRKQKALQIVSLSCVLTDYELVNFKIRIFKGAFSLTLNERLCKHLNHHFWAKYYSTTRVCKINNALEKTLLLLLR